MKSLPVVGGLLGFVASFEVGTVASTVLVIFLLAWTFFIIWYHVRTNSVIKKLTELKHDLDLLKNVLE